jgi:hypothetical protein
MRIALSIGAMMIAAIVAALIGANVSWRRGTANKVERLASTIADPSRIHGSAFQDRLPAPVARYFTRALKDIQHTVRSTIAAQQAEFFINGGWRPLTATQYFTTAPPGFVWDARIGMAPLMTAQVRDAYVSGSGSLQASIYGLYPIVDLEGAPELNSGALQRFLGEAVWFPTALLPSSSVTWTPRDDQSATVTLIDGETRVSLLFEFDDRDDVVQISGDRFKETNGGYQMQPWVIHCAEHGERSGMRIPLFCEVAWIGEGGPEPYWRGRITKIEYVFWQ